MKLLPQDFIHPDDQAALNNLQSLPLFPECMKAFMRLGWEQFFHGTNMAQKIRLGPDQLPEIYRYLLPICDRLDIQEPELYLEMNPQPNAYTYGDTRTFVTLTSGLLEYLEEDEIQAVIAHECGHIFCRHVLYHTMATLIIQFGVPLLGLPELVTMPVRLALAYWQRRSELSSDRAAAVAMGDARPVVDTMIRLAGGPKSLTGNVNLDLYLKQADAYDHLQESQWDKALQGLAIMNAEHPFPAVRAREITRWCATDQFKKVIQALASEPPRPRCPHCTALLTAGWKFCQACGQPVSPPAAAA